MGGRAFLGLCFSLLGWCASSAYPADTSPSETTSTVTAPPKPEGPYPPTAVGEYRPALDIVPGGVKAGPFTVSPIVSAAAGYDDNVGLRSANKNASSLYIVSPGVSAAARNGVHRYHARYLGNYAHYASSGRDDYHDHSAGLGAESDWTSRLRTQLRYDYFRGHDPRGATASALDAPDRWASHDLRAAVSYGARGARGNLEGEAGVGSRRYQTNREVTAARDYERADLAGAFFYRMQPSVYTLIQIKAGRFDYETNPTLDSTEMRYLAGLRWDTTAKTQGSVRAGYMTKRFSNGSRPDASEHTYEANVTWSPLTYSVFRLNAVRAFSEQTSGGAYILTDNGAVNWSHDWTERVRSNVLLAYGRDAHEGLSRTDNRRNVGIKAIYAFRRTLRLGSEVRHEERRSNVSGVGYERNLFMLTVEGTL